MFVFLLMSLSATFSSQVYACRWNGYGRGHMGGHYNTKDSIAYQKILDNTVQLRQELAAKQYEYNTVLANPESDHKRAEALSREIMSLKDRLRTQAQAYNINMQPMNYCYGYMGSYGWGWQ